MFNSPVQTADRLRTQKIKDLRTDVRNDIPSYDKLIFFQKLLITAVSGGVEKPNKRSDFRGSE